MSDLVTLIMPGGDAWTYPPSHDTEMFIPYRLDHTDPHSHWAIDVPRHVASHFLHRGGFLLWSKPT